MNKFTQQRIKNNLLLIIRCVSVSSNNVVNCYVYPCLFYLITLIFYKVYENTLHRNVDEMLCNKFPLIFVTVNLLLQLNTPEGSATVLSDTGQAINLLAVKTAECNFCGMTFFGTISFKVRMYLVVSFKTDLMFSKIFQLYLILIQLIHFILRSVETQDAVTHHGWKEGLQKEELIISKIICQENVVIILKLSRMRHLLFLVGWHIVISSATVSEYILYENIKHYSYIDYSYTYRGNHFPSRH